MPTNLRASVIHLSPEAREVLSRATIDATSVRLPPGQLARALYLEIDKALGALGGKWNRKAGAHLFNTDPRPALSGTAATGTVPDEKKTLQFFETPADVVAEMRDLLQPKPHERLLEPEAGRGAIAKVFQPLCKEVVCVDIHTPHVDYLRGLGIRAVAGDFLKLVPGALGAPFDLVAMNPPFTRGQDIEHVMHAWQFLRPGGRMAAITLPSWRTREGRKWQAFREFVNTKGVAVRVRDLPPGAFKQSGTNVRTLLLVLGKA